MQGEEVDTLLLSVLHLLQTSRHLSLRTTINECYVSTQTLSRTARVHSCVATTHYEHVLAQIHWGIGLRVGSIHEVHTSEVLV